MKFDSQANQAVDSSSSKRTRPIDFHAMPVDVSHGFNLPGLTSVGGMFMNPYTPPMLPVEYSGALPGLSGPSADMFQLALPPVSSSTLVEIPVADSRQGSVAMDSVPGDYGDWIASPSDDSLDWLDDVFNFFGEPEASTSQAASASVQSPGSFANSVQPATSQAAPQAQVAPASDGTCSPESIQDILWQFLAAGGDIDDIAPVAEQPGPLEPFPTRAYADSTVPSHESPDDSLDWLDDLLGNMGSPLPEPLTSEAQSKPVNSKRQAARSHSAETIQSVCSLLNAGTSSREIRKRFKIPKTTLSRWKKRLEHGETAEQISKHHTIRRQYAPKVVQEVCHMLAQREKLSELSKKYEIPESTLKLWKKRLSQGETQEQISKPKARFLKQYSPKMVQEVCRLLQQWEKFSDISSRLKISESTLSRWKKRMEQGETPEQIHASMKHYPPGMVQDACHMLKRGNAMVGITRWLKIPEPTLSHWKKRLSQGETPEQISHYHATAKHYSLELVQEACHLLAQRERLSESTKRYEIPESTLKMWRKRLNQGETPEQISHYHATRQQYASPAAQEARRLLAQWESIPEISKKFNIPYSTLYEWYRHSSHQGAGQTSASSGAVPPPMGP